MQAATAPTSQAKEQLLPGPGPKTAAR